MNDASPTNVIKTFKKRIDILSKDLQADTDLARVWTKMDGSEEARRALNDLTDIGHDVHRARQTAAEITSREKNTPEPGERHYDEIPF